MGHSETVNKVLKNSVLEMPTDGIQTHIPDLYVLLKHGLTSIWCFLVLWQLPPNYKLSKNGENKFGDVVDIAPIQ